MSLKIKINKNSMQATESRPSKRRAQRIAYTDDEDEDDAGDTFYEKQPRKKRAKTTSRGASADSGEGDAAVDEDIDVDVDGDIEDARFLPDPQPSGSRPMSPVATSSVKLRLPGRSKEKEREREWERPPRQIKPTKKVKRSVVFTDSDEEVNEPVVVVTSDEDFDPGSDVGSSKRSLKGKATRATAGRAGGKARVARVDEEESEEDIFRDERKPPPAPSLDTAKRDAKNVPDPLDDPIPKKRKLPPIKKNKQPGSSSAGSSTPAVQKAAAAVPPAEKREALTPAPTSNQVGARKPAGASTDVNLLDSAVYSELFRSTPGTSTPNSGLNRKQKEEERRKELNKMRAEARAKREAEAKNAFDLQAAPDKIQRFEEMLKLRQSMARYPNILGASLKELFDRRARGLMS